MSLTYAEKYFPTFFRMEDLTSVVFILQGTLTYENETERQLEARGHYSSSANWPTETSLDISRGIWNFLMYVRSFYISPTFLAETPTISSGALVDNIKSSPTHILFSYLCYIRSCDSPSAHRRSHCPVFSNRTQAVLTSDLWTTPTPSIKCGLCPRYWAHFGAMGRILTPDLWPLTFYIFMAV